MIETPERTLPENIFRAHALAGNAHEEGAKPLTRLGGALAVGAIGVGGERLLEFVRPTVFRKIGVEKLELHPLLDALLNDGLVGALYTVVNKNLGEALPKLKLRHFTTSTVGTMAVVGVEGISGKVREVFAKRRGQAAPSATPDTGASVATTPVDTAQAAPAENPAAALAVESPVATQKKKFSFVDYINPVTALAADEARMAVMDWWEAYQAVVSGTEEKFIEAHAPKDKKNENSTVIFVGGGEDLTTFLGTSDCPGGACAIPTLQASS
ncbi:hypothetical protein A2973_05735 [Candidatus Gottesmanbacteria bacterium RIFCSPLOWO2_01_FULL_49_10]|uniref:Uncharacterized protein n=1 Tax=Candidatus Gottesmanbacteria bacterium RIFCSPLOWO2_01_FULL_49_10 TaxID=1798396 RepID=A0A1F6B0W0_9BACT|nr:MAG: hypothetical protein A2973_05735 [Candidatus Gottesmanbacteria bacterium RIFCSPLOWO2_01_FULL_49_10]